MKKIASLARIEAFFHFLQGFCIHTQKREGSKWAGRLVLEETAAAPRVGLTRYRRWAGIAKDLHSSAL